MAYPKRNHMNKNKQENHKSMLRRHLAEWRELQSKTNAPNFRAIIDKRIKQLEIELAWIETGEDQ